ncbi:hypothetical protein GLOIN_2v1501867 [Rhizophagus clarus]|uniref:Uncharacterized protein n=1 Tax=Rhizophagus clarus TaxID=94130 RepID=A0A8H3LDM7_9GLOM|nr:hypothetical protein GLOIN_2v1501867 [Rhizophagus clarus]
MVTRREDDTLQGVLRIFYRKLQFPEKIFLYAYLIDMIGYTLLFITFLSFTGYFFANFASILLVLFPIISGITMFYSKTILHGISFLVVHSFPIIVGVSLFYAQNNNCSDKTNLCFFGKDTIYYTSAVLLLTFLFAFTIFYCIILYYLWSKKVWPIRHKYPHVKDEEIIRLDSVYQLQFPIFHAKIMTVEFYTVLYMFAIWITSILTKDLSGIKGVRDETRWMMYCLYLGNIFQAIFLYYVTAKYCYESFNTSSLKYCSKYSFLFNVFLGLTIITWIILILSTWNSIRCQRNFGKYNIGFFLKYEPTPDVFKPGRKLQKRETPEPTELDF